MLRYLLVISAVVAALALASGVAVAVVKNGGPGDDTIRGTDNPDTLRGGAGDDTIVGLAARDRLAGDDGDDTIDGGSGNDDLLGGSPRSLGDSLPPKESPAGNDTLRGGPGDDFLDGYEGEDSLSGGSGSDIILDGEGHGGQLDTLSGGPGNDFLLPRNTPAGQDVVHCGEGRDTVYADRADIVGQDCERVRFRNP